MRKESLEFLRKLMDVPSPSGFEQPAQRVFREYTAEFADEVETDVHGNTTAILNRDGKLRVMLAGHCDELGLMVNHIEDAGFIRFAAIGGIDQALLPGSRVVVHSKRGPVRGVIGKKPIHLLKPEERKKVLEIKRLWIDIGARNKADAGKVVEVGDPITMAGGFELLRNQLAVSRGFDDKIGSFVVAETVRLLSGGKLKAAVFGVSTVQEELGLRGAQTSAFGIDPHVGPLEDPPRSNPAYANDSVIMFHRVDSSLNQSVITLVQLFSSVGFHNAIRTAARRDRAAPKKKGAEAPKPCQPPAPCYKRPAMSDAGKSSKPSTALYVP